MAESGLLLTACWSKQHSGPLADLHGLLHAVHRAGAVHNDANSLHGLMDVGLRAVQLADFAAHTLRLGGRAMHALGQALCIRFDHLQHLHMGSHGLKAGCAGRACRLMVSHGSSGLVLCMPST